MRRLVATAALAALVGCGGGNATVEGKVVWADGTAAKELVGGVVQLEPKGDRPAARGVIGADGTFHLGTDRDGDGVPPGEYRVGVAENLAVLREMDNGTVIQAPPKMDPKFNDWDRSGLTIVVKPGSNEVTLTVERARRK